MSDNPEQRAASRPAHAKKAPAKAASAMRASNGAHARKPAAKNATAAKNGNSAKAGNTARRRPAKPATRSAAKPASRSAAKSATRSAAAKPAARSAATPATKSTAAQAAATPAAPKRPRKRPVSAAVNAAANAFDTTSFSFTHEDPPAVEGVVQHILPVLSVILAFTAAIALFRFVFPPPAPAEEVTEESGLVDPALVEAQTAEPATQGVEDKWSPTGTFTSGNDNLDNLVKTFCDAIEKQSQNSDARSLAQTTYNAIMQSEPAYNPAPQGNDWTIVCAEQYFSKGAPDQGVGGPGDNYDLAAATMYCLRYFGFDNAVAIPCVGEKAYCIVTDTQTGARSLCDPNLGVNGWMLDAANYDLVVQDIGQDLSVAEGMGLTIQRNEASADPNAAPDAAAGAADQPAGAPGAPDATGGEYGTGGEYDASGEYGAEYGTEYDTGYDPNAYV